MSSSSQHFSSVGAGTADRPGRYVDVAAIAPLEMLPGLTFQPVMGEGTIVNFVSFEPHSIAPMHTHVEAQIVLVLEGELEFTLDGHVRTMRPGDVAVIPPWVPHGAVTHDIGCREIDIFTPPRATLVDQAQAALAASTIEP